MSNGKRRFEVVIGTVFDIEIKKAVRRASYRWMTRATIILTVLACAVLLWQF